MTDSLKDANKVVGLKQVKRALKSSKAKKIYIARDAEKRLTSELVDYCEEWHIPIVYVESMKKLGHACGIDINAAVAALII